MTAARSDRQTRITKIRFVKFMTFSLMVIEIVHSGWPKLEFGTGDGCGSFRTVAIPLKNRGSGNRRIFQEHMSGDTHSNGGVTRDLGRRRVVGAGEAGDLFLDMSYSLQDLRKVIGWRRVGQCEQQVEALLDARPAGDRMFKSLLTTLLVSAIAPAVYNSPRAQGQTLLRRHGARGHSLLVGFRLNVQPIIAVTAVVCQSERASAPGGVENILNLVFEA